MENEQAVQDKILLLSTKVNNLEQIAIQIQAETVRLGGGEVEPPSPPTDLPSGPGPDLVPILDQIEEKISVIERLLQTSLDQLRSAKKI